MQVHCGHMWYVVAKQERQQNQRKQVSLLVALRHHSNLNMITASLTDNLQTSAKTTVFTDFSPVPDQRRKDEFRTLLIWVSSTNSSISPPTHTSILSFQPQFDLSPQSFLLKPNDQMITKCVCQARTCKSNKVQCWPCKVMVLGLAVVHAGNDKPKNGPHWSKAAAPRTKVQATVMA